MVWIWLSLFLNSSQIKRGKKRKPNQQHGTQQKVLCFSSPVSHRCTAYQNCAPAETKKKPKGSCCTSLEAQSFSSSIYKLWHMLAPAMKLFDRKNGKKKEKERQERGECGQQESSSRVHEAWEAVSHVAVGCDEDDEAFLPYSSSMTSSHQPSSLTWVCSAC